MLLRSYHVPAPRRVLSPVAFAPADVLVASLIPALPRQPGTLFSTVAGETGKIKQAGASTLAATRSMQPALTNLPLTVQQGTGSAAFTAHTAGGALYFHTDGVTLALAVSKTGGKIELWDVTSGEVAGTIDNLPDEAISLLQGFLLCSRVVATLHQPRCDKGINGERPARKLASLKGLEEAVTPPQN